MKMKRHKRKTHQAGGLDSGYVPSQVLSKETCGYVTKIINRIKDYNYRHAIMNPAIVNTDCAVVDSLTILLKYELNHLSVKHLGLEQDKLYKADTALKLRRLKAFMEACEFFRNYIYIKAKSEKAFWKELNTHATSLNHEIDLQITDILYDKLIGPSAVILKKYPKRSIIVTLSRNGRSRLVKKFIEKNFDNHKWDVNDDRFLRVESEQDINYLKLVHPDAVDHWVNTYKFIAPLEKLLEQINSKFVLVTKAEPN